MAAAAWRLIPTNNAIQSPSYRHRRSFGHRTRHRPRLRPRRRERHRLGCADSGGRRNRSTGAASRRQSGVRERRPVPPGRRASAGPACRVRVCDRRLLPRRWWFPGALSAQHGPSETGPCHTDESRSLFHVGLWRRASQWTHADRCPISDSVGIEVHADGPPAGREK